MPREKQLRSRSRVTTRSAVPSRKSVTPILCEAIGELNFALLMEYSTNIVEIQSQPYTFRFEVNGVRYRYTPDFMVTRSCGSYAYVEVKHSRSLNKKEVREKLAIADAYFEETEKEFHVLTELELSNDAILLSNIRLLKRYRALTRERLKTISAHIPQAATTISQLQAQLELAMDSDSAQLICTELIANQLVWCDLRQELQLNSTIKPMDGDGYVFIANF